MTLPIRPLARIRASRRGLTVAVLGVKSTSLILFGVVVGITVDNLLLRPWLLAMPERSRPFERPARDVDARDVSAALGMEWFIYRLKTDHPKLSLEVRNAEGTTAHDLIGFSTATKAGTTVRLALTTSEDRSETSVVLFEDAPADGQPRAIAVRNKFPNPFKDSTFVSSRVVDGIVPDDGVLKRGSPEGQTFLSNDPADSDIVMRIVER